MKRSDFDLWLHMWAAIGLWIRLGLTHPYEIERQEREREKRKCDLADHNRDDLEICSVCDNLITTVDRDNRRTVSGITCGQCVREYQAIATLEGALAEIHQLMPACHTAWMAVFGKRDTSPEVCELITAWIERWYSERGHSVSASFELRGQHLRISIMPRDAFQLHSVTATVKL